MNILISTLYLGSCFGTLGYVLFRGDCFKQRVISAVTRLAAILIIGAIFYGIVVIVADILYIIFSHLVSL